MRKNFLQRKLQQCVAFMSLVGIFFAPFSSILAASIPSVGKVANKLEARYNVNGDSIRDTMQSFNVNNRKKTVPEVSIFFSPSDPKSGEKITARAMPIYFSNPSESMYYTWYLKRKDCNASTCDYNGDGAYNSKDWRIEAAGILVQNGYDNADPGTSYAVDDDNDGYKARFGGDDKEGKADYCAVYDPRSGDVYELANTGSSISFSCPGGTSPTCLEGETQINPETSTITFGGGGVDIFGEPVANSGGGTITPFSEISPNCNVGGCSSVGTPVCAGGHTPTCTSGIPCCVADPATATVCSASLLSCRATTGGSITNLCKHVFAHPGGLTSGDGSFGAGEERFWKTNPRDPSTANNGQKDEATVVGLGRDTFSWTYFSGDEVGVAVEGTSMIPTKHDDSSSYVMWAFSKNKCNPSLVGGSTSQYVQSVKNYPVAFPTADMDPNDCISHNLVNPTEGGQSSNLAIQLNVNSGSLTNDETSDKSGDFVTVQTSIENALQESSNMHYDWIIDISANPRFTSSTNITAAAISSELTTRTKGNDLSTLHFKMNMPAALLGGMSGGTGYIRFRLRAEENISGGGIRKGNSEVIAKFTSTGKRIQAYLVDPVAAGSRTHVKLNTGAMICNGSALERTACQVIKNEVIGLRVDSTGLRDFSWQINQKPLMCNQSGVSPDCSDTAQGNTVFFPVTGKTGDSYDVTVTATNTATGQEVTLSRLFYVIDPYVQIVSSDTAVAWKKLLGFYRDVLGTATTNCPSGLCPNYSDEALQTFSGSVVVLKAEYVPRFITSHPGLHTEWRVDGESIEESVTDTISFPIKKFGGTSYDISFQAIILQTDLMRRALYDIWNISPLDSTESNFSGKMQVEVQDGALASGNEKGIKKYYALLSSYVPETFLFTFRVLLLGFLTLFGVNFFGSLIITRRFSRKTK
ncbi:MAG: hypothetical protein KBC19_01520 [Candidatus Moranbacteria bacterium]|nr:hypothetical protein [Candidatus Moranbacteria bacterium]